MAVKIRLARFGTKKRPHYRIVATDVQNPRDGRFLEILGTYNPLVEPARVIFKQERVQHWIDQGARPTPTVRSLLKNNGFNTPPVAAE